jgi:hypothetical protein
MYTEDCGKNYHKLKEGKRYGVLQETGTILGKIKLN